MYATARQFADWIFWRNNRRYPRLEDEEVAEARQVRGTYTTAMVRRFMTWMNLVGLGRDADWQVEFRDDGRSAGRVFLSTELKVGSEALHCRPDLVLIDSSSNSRVIVERKRHHVYHPKQLRAKSFQNIWAQLWCYAHIDDWRGSQLILVSELEKVLHICYPCPEDRREHRHLTEVHSEIGPLFAQWKVTRGAAGSDTHRIPG